MTTRIMNSKGDDEVRLAAIQLADGIQSCRSVVKNYRAMLIDTQSAADDEFASGTHVDLEPPSRHDGYCETSGANRR